MAQDARDEGVLSDECSVGSVFKFGSRKVYARQQLLQAFEAQNITNNLVL